MADILTRLVNYIANQILNHMTQTSQEHPLAGIYSAAVTPINIDFSPDLSGMPVLLAFLAQRGCHGALILGTTGEGPSFSSEQRIAIYKAALQIRQDYPEFRLLAGTGTPSLDETIKLTRAAFDLGYDGVVVLPPYYYRKVDDQGLFQWFSRVIERSVPGGGHFLGYHIPDVSGVPLSIELLARLKDAFLNQFMGIKDSSGNTALAETLGSRFGKDLVVFTGNDRLLSFAIENQAAGCITACANLISPDLRKVWEAFHRGEKDILTQEKINLARQVIERYPPLPSVIKGLLARICSLPQWSVCPPLLPSPDDIYENIINELNLA